MPDDDDDDRLMTITDQNGRDVDIRRHDVLQAFGPADRVGPRHWVDFVTITTAAGAADAARHVLAGRYAIGQPWRIVRDGRVILK